MSRRILIYSHDTFGIGNIRRTIELSRAISRRMPDVSILIITGSPMADAFHTPANVDYVKLPSLVRVSRGDYRARMDGHTTASTQAMRAGICLAAIENFAPDLVLVDKAPFGVDGELSMAFERTRDRLPGCRYVLVLRDILDSGDVVRHDWVEQGINEAIASHYDAIWVLGDRGFFDLAAEYALPPAVVGKMTYLGFIGRTETPAPPAVVRQTLGLNGGPLVLFTAGGGDDGDHLLTTSARTLPALERGEPGVQSVMVSGPQASRGLRDLLARTCGDHPQRRFFVSSTELTSWMNAADAVVAMGGYNTTCEILWLRKKALVVPRCHPVQEQILRAQRLAARGAIRMCSPGELSPRRLVTEIRTLLHDFTPGPLDPVSFPFDGLERASSEVERLLAGKIASGTRDLATR